jgi:hypothetical protein
MAIDVQKVWDPQTLDFVLAGPGTSNWLFLFTGIAEIDWRAPRGIILIRDSVELDLSKWHKDVHFDLNATQLAAVAWPSSMHGDNAADEMTWAVDAAYAFVSAAKRPTLHVDLAVQGEKGNLGRIAYQVFVRTTSIPIKDFVVRQGGAPELTVTVVVSGRAVGNGEEIYLSSSDSRAKLPATLTVPADSYTATRTVALDLAPFPSGNTSVLFTARNAVNEQRVTTVIHKA